MNTPPQKTVLHVDDDPDDRELIAQAIIDADSTIMVQQRTNAKSGLDYLRACKAEQQFPCLIILDINMPQLDGKQASKIIKADKELSEIPLILFTTSSTSEDKKFCAEHGIEMVTKPSSFQNLSNIIRKMLVHCLPV